MRTEVTVFWRKLTPTERTVIATLIERSVFSRRYIKIEELIRRMDLVANGSTEELSVHAGALLDNFLEEKPNATAEEVIAKYFY